MTNRTTSTYYAAKFFSEGGFYIPVWLFYLTTQCHLAESQAFLVQSSLFFAIMISEIPSGAWADRLGRKKLLVLSGLLRVTSLLIYCFLNHFFLLIFANLLQGFATSCASGTLEAIVTDNLKSEDKSSEGIFENGHSLLFFGRALAVLAGGLLYTLNPIIPYVAALVYAILFLVFVASMDEHPFTNSAAKNNSVHLGQNFRLIANNQMLCRWLLCISVLFIFVNLSWFQYQAIFSKFGWDSKMTGLIYCWGALCSGVGSWLSKSAFRDMTGRSVLVFSSLAWGCGILLLTINNLWLILFGVLVFSIPSGIIYPAYVRLVNTVVPASQRATTISLIGFCEVTACASITSIAGYLNQWVGVIPLVRSAGLMVLLLTFLALYALSGEGQETVE